MFISHVFNFIRAFFIKVNSRLASKLIFLFSILVVVITFTLTYMSYDRTTAILQNDFLSTNKHILKLVSQNMDNYVSQITNLSLEFMKDENIMNSLIFESDTYADTSYLKREISRVLFSNNDIETIEFTIPKLKKLYSINRKAALSDKFLIVNNYTVDHYPWYKKAIEDKGFKYIEPSFSNYKDYSSETKSNTLLNYHRIIIRVNNKEPLAAVSLGVNYSIAKNILAEGYGRKGEYFGLFSKDKTPFYFSHHEILDFQIKTDFLSNINQSQHAGWFNIEVNDEKYLVIYNNSEKNNWTLIKIISIGLLNESAEKTRTLSFMLSTIFLFVFIILVVLISRTITRPLRRLSKQMDKVGGGNFDVMANISGNDEITRLSDKFNLMVSRIKELIDEEYKSKLNLKNAQLKALEAQINPHFLYNSLQVISTEALEIQAKKIGKMVDSLASTLRYCFKEAESVPISREIKHIKSYLVIQRARFEERLRVQFTIDEEITNIRIPKLSIQTLVENSIEHALEKTSKKVTIEILVIKEADKAVIKVKDNGPGIKKERLDKIMDDLIGIDWMKDNDSIGLKNLFVRLKLMFNDEARIDILSEEGQGTEIIITLPIKQ